MGHCPRVNPDLSDVPADLPVSCRVVRLNGDARIIHANVISPALSHVQIPGSGMSLEEVLKACTTRPADIIGLKSVIGPLAPQRTADIVTLRIIEQESCYYDCQNGLLKGNRLLAPQTIKDGNIVFRQASFNGEQPHSCRKGPGRTQDFSLDRDRPTVLWISRIPADRRERRIGKTVRFRRGPAAVTGDKGRLMSLSVEDGKARPEGDPEARRPVRSCCVSLALAERGRGSESR